MRSRVRLFSFTLAGTALAGAMSSACAPRPAARLAPDGGLSYRHLSDSAGPWAIDVLEADRRACWSAVAVKGARGAVGRRTTSALLAQLDSLSEGEVGGGVNADFFLFAPPGVPVGPHVSAGRLISGPTNRPAVWFDAGGRPAIGDLRSRGFVRFGTDSLPLDAWNRRDGAVRLVDPNWGDSTVAGAGLLEVTVAGSPARVVQVDSGVAAVAIPRDGAVIVLDSTTSPALRARVAAWRDRVTWRAELTPVMPAEAVGGFPVLVRDSAVVDGLDRAGGANFGPVRHPRTAVGIAADGQRLLLVTVDGRQEGWSAGMTLRELAELMRRLGAHDAINLDGGGSTAMVVRRGDSLRVMNRPSDRTGERPVANALALVRRCR